MSIRWYLAELGARVRGISLMFDLVSYCSFRCPSCPVGNSAKRKPEVMPLSKFGTILDVVRSQTRIRYILLYSFSEPGLHPQLGEIVREAKQRTRRVMLSTNLSHPERIVHAMMAGVDEVRISFSGWERGEYFHMGRKMEQFNAACKMISGAAARYGTRVGLIWHRYKTNLHEEGEVEGFAEALGFRLIRETAFFIPFEKITGDIPYTQADRELIGHLIQTPDEKLAQSERDPICYYQQKQMVIDPAGDVFLCRHVYDRQFVVGNIIEDTVKELRRRMAKHWYCLVCKSHGLNTYTEPK